MNSYLGTSYFSAGGTTDVGFKRNELQIALCDPKLGINDIVYDHDIMILFNSNNNYNKHML
jgi:hypothetical protein